MNQNDYLKIIEDFSNKKFAYYFLDKYREELNIKGKVSDLHLKIYCKEHIKVVNKLIVSYVFLDDNQRKNITIKLRTFHRINLSKKSWLTSSFIWKQIKNKKNKFIIEPIYYFDQYNVFVYKTAIGESFGVMLKNKTLTSFDDISEKIRIITNALISLHKIDISDIDKSIFKRGYNSIKQLDKFQNYLTNNQDILLFRDEVLKILSIVSALLDKFKSKKQSLIHGDYQVGNFIFNNNEIRLIDFDLAEINDPLIDVGNFLTQIFYKGFIGPYVDLYRKQFLRDYLNNNENVDRTNLNERLNLYIIIAQIRNVSKLMFNKKIINDKHNIIEDDLKHIQCRLDNLKKDPLYFWN